MAKKTGRPPKADGQKKGRYLQVRVDEGEKSAFDEAAQLAGVDLSVWVRLRLRECAKRELQKEGRDVAFMAGK